LKSDLREETKIWVAEKSKSNNRKGRKDFTCLPAGRRKGRKGHNINVLPLRSLRNPSRSLRLKRLF
jgi:hypothetical protein